jgi:dTDP-glucose 4,6-dehydratase
MIILVTGGAGFIGSAFVLEWIAGRGTPVVTLDKLTYAGNPANLATLACDNRHTFVQGDINDRALVRDLLARHAPDAIVHFAAESHVDRSIHDPEAFVRTNVNGTWCLLEESRTYWGTLPAARKESFRFLHVSTDEVYGSLGPKDPPFTEEMPYRPNSPYAASKAGSDHLVRAYHHTYGLPTLLTNCSNNFGPRQFPEKLIPLMILNALVGKPLPVYGDGSNVRDWLYVTDHCAAIREVLAHGTPGETYLIGGRNERTNLDLVKTLCRVLDDLHPTGRPHDRLVTFVTDRPGHDRRYAIDCAKLERELGWRAQTAFDTAVANTARWYLDNDTWVQQVTSGEYRQWIDLNYQQRASA